MKLLICTQVVDKNHPILGFFHRWIEEFAKHCESVHVICLYEGEHSLPAHVHVHSLGKEGGESRIKYLIRFYSYIWNLRNEYDSIFVHMNQIYVILGAPLWRLLGKRIGLWYAHGKVSNSLKIAEKLTHTIFTSTEEGLQLATPKKKIVGQGIDLERFAYKERAEIFQPLKLITVGRISRSKNIDTLIDACALLKKEGIDFTFSIVGTALTEEEKEYEKTMREKVITLRLEDHVYWRGAVSQQELPSRLQEADIFIHDGATQSLDKALLEAVACGCVVVSSNLAYATLTEEFAPQYIYSSRDFSSVAKIIKKLTTSTVSQSVDSMRFIYETIKAKHAIDALINRMVNTLQI